MASFTFFGIGSGQSQESAVVRESLSSCATPQVRNFVIVNCSHENGDVSSSVLTFF